MNFSEASKTVLIICGGVRTRDQLCLALSREGCLIRVTGREDAGLALIEQDAPDAVLFDPFVSELGVQHFQQRLLEKNPRARLVLIVSETDNCKRATWNGVRHFLKSPFTQNALVEALSLRGR
jgi:DNA-binding NtrC family response regulator